MLGKRVIHQPIESFFLIIRAEHFINDLFDRFPFFYFGWFLGRTHWSGEIRESHRRKLFSGRWRGRTVTETTTHTHRKKGKLIKAGRNDSNKKPTGISITPVSSGCTFLFRALSRFHWTLRPSISVNWIGNGLHCSWNLEINSIFLQGNVHSASRSN